MSTWRKQDARFFVIYSWRLGSVRGNRLAQRDPGSPPELFCFVGALPGQVQIITTKVTVVRHLAVDRAAQVQVANDGAGAEVEVSPGRAGRSVRPGSRRCQRSRH